MAEIGRVFRRHARWAFSALVAASAVSVAAACTHSTSPQVTSLFTPSAPLTVRSSPSAPTSQPARIKAPPRVPKRLISLPLRSVTPGAVSQTDVNAVCSSPLRQHIRPSRTILIQVYNDYGLQLPSSGAASDYQIDYLVPLTLGGSASRENIWPIAIRGVGYSDKVKLTSTLRTKVCRGELKLSYVQRQFERNWSVLWNKYH